MDQIPEEDDIRKTDLWKKIDYTRDVSEKLRGELGTQVENSKDFVINELKRKLMENQEDMDKFSKDLDVKLKEFKVTLETVSNDTVAALQRRLDENLGKIEAKFNTLQNDVYKKIDDSSQSFTTETKNSMTNTKKELEVVVNNSISGIQAKVTDMRRYLDTRLSGLDEATVKKAEVAVSNSLHELIQRSKEVQEALEETRKETSESMTKFQAETMSKVSALNTLFKSIQSKFSVIAESLK